jgi:hypothetical protein
MTKTTTISPARLDKALAIRTEYLALRKAAAALRVRLAATSDSREVRQLDAELAEIWAQEGRLETKLITTFLR